MPRLKRCCAIHDLSGFGRVSLTVVIPTLSAMGIQVVPAPTAVLSTHTGGAFPGYSFCDLTDSMEASFRHWKELHLEFDAIYSGFLGSPRQCDLVDGLIRNFRREDSLVMVDPVMGDRGDFYASISPTMAGEMRKLVAQADVITPNLTELFLLLDRPYNPEISPEAFRDLLEELADMGPQQIVVTSCPGDQEGQIACRLYDHGKITSLSQDYFDVQYQGTGDLYSTILLGLLMTGSPFDKACKLAATEVLRLMKGSVTYGEPYTDGVFLEAFLPELGQLVDRDQTLTPGYREGRESLREVPAPGKDFLGNPGK
ncbi:MAG: pyridoxamine kinase [Firmicutes bacterium]|nr:pyridoxamine kinase [Bacillota bacterium]